MSNDFYNYTGNILPLGVARSQPIVQQFDAIARAFNKIPNPAGTVRGFSQPVQVGPAEQNNQAATLGQVQQIVDAIMGSNPLSVGNLQPVFRGAYDAGTSYSPLEFVAWNDGLFVNILASQGIAPSNAANWLQVMDPLVTGIAYYELLSGAVSRPLIAFHNGDYWMLTMDLPDVTAAVPGASVAWQRIPEDTIYIAQPTIIDPADGDTEFFGDVTASAYATGERFTGAHTKSIWQASEVSDFATVYAEEEVTEGDLTVWTLPLPAPLAEVWIRVRYESAGFSSSWSPITRIVVANYSADPAEFISPTAAQTGWVPGTAFQITTYTPNIIDTHQSTSWQVMNSLGTVIWQSLEDTANLTTITAPDNIFSPEAVYTVRARHIGTFFGEQEWSAPVTFTTIGMPTPTHTAPANLATDVYPGVTLTAESLAETWVHETSQWRVLRVSDSAVIHDSGETSVSLTSYTLPSTLFAPSTQYQWQVRAKTAEYGMGPWSTLTAYTTAAAPVPTQEIPLAGEIDVGPTPTITISTPDDRFSYTASQFEVTRDIDGTVVYDSGEVLAGITSIQVPADILYPDTVYRWRARVKSAEYNAYGAYSSYSLFTTIALFPPIALVAGTPTMFGSPTAIFVDESYMYFASQTVAPYLKILNKDTWAEQTIPAIAEGVLDVISDASYIYIALLETGLLVLNKADFSVVAGTVSLGRFCTALSQDANYLYASTDVPVGYAVIAKTNLSSEMAGLSALSGGGIGRDIKNDANYVYITSNQSPYLEVVSKTTWEKVSSPTMATYGDVRETLEVDDNYLYVSQNTSPRLTIFNTPGFSVFSNNPIVGSLEAMMVDDVYLHYSDSGSGNQAYRVHKKPNFTVGGEETSIAGLYTRIFVTDDRVYLGLISAPYLAVYRRTP